MTIEACNGPVCGKIWPVRSRTWLVAALLFGSGFCALVYQVGWLRDFRLIFGASTAASAAVLAIFIGGLGVGGLLLGPRADRHPRPLVLYAQLELIVAVSAAATPVLLSAVRYLYLSSGGSTGLGSTVATIARVVLSALVLAVPTIAMGGTLPAAARAATRASDARRQDLAAVYALNTLGAVVGCIVATFWLLEIFGTHNTIWLAAAANGAIASVAMVIGRMFGDVRSDEDQQAGVAGEAGEAGRLDLQAGKAGPGSDAWQERRDGRDAGTQRPGARPRSRPSSPACPTQPFPPIPPLLPCKCPSGSCSSPPAPSASRSS